MGSLHFLEREHCRSFNIQDWDITRRLPEIKAPTLVTVGGIRRGDAKGCGSDSQRNSRVQFDDLREQYSSNNVG